MTPENIHKKQTSFFKTRATIDVKYRIKTLQKLEESLRDLEEEIYAALKLDLFKSKFEAYLTEVQVVQKELKTYLGNTKKWSKPQRVSPSIFNFPSKARRYPEPYGTTLIISPWNYPFQLAMAPLIAAVAAGNTVVLKPSEFSTATSDILEKLITKSFDPAHVFVKKGDAEISKQLTSLKWDYIFFTGSPGVGQKIYEAAAKHMTPVTLELGGKNPAVIHESANLKISAKRIVWTKFLNAGQTCIAPDYILVHEKVKNKLVELLKMEITHFFGADPKQSEDFPRIIREAHLETLIGFIKGETIITGGSDDKEQLYLAPTLLDEPNRQSEVMKNEIFGPILPIITYSSKSDIEGWIDSYDKPLGAYVFSSDNTFTHWFINRFSFGGGAVNDTIVQFINDKLPFGGVGTSGIGSYHGKKSFEIFSHYKSVVHRGTWLDFSFKYPPYTISVKRLQGLFKWI